MRVHLTAKKTSINSLFFYETWDMLCLDNFMIIIIRRWLYNDYTGIIWWLYADRTIQTSCTIMNDVWTVIHSMDCEWCLLKKCFFLSYIFQYENIKNKCPNFTRKLPCLSFVHFSSIKKKKIKNKYPNLTESFHGFLSYIYERKPWKLSVKLGYFFFLMKDV